MPDLSELRKDLLAFSRAIGHPMEPWQAAAFMVSVFIRVILAPRQSGKSRALAIYALWCAFRRQKVLVLVVSASEDASRRLLAEVRRIASSSPLLRGSITDEFAGLLTLTNGSEIRSVPASERQVRGWSVDHGIVDEAALVSDELFHSAFLPTVAARPGADITLASSAGANSGFFFDFAVSGERGDAHARTWRWPLKDCHWITPSMIEAMRESMSETRFRAEMEGIWATGADALFTRATLERVIADVPLGRLTTLTGPARVYGGVDWGASNDRSACVAIGRVPVENDDPVFAVVAAERWPAGYPLNSVIGDIAESPAHWKILTMERNGLGEPCCQDLARRIRRRPNDEGGARPRRTILIQENHPSKRAKKRSEGQPRGWPTRLHPVYTSAPMKAASYSALRMMVDREQIVFPASATELIRELLLLRVDLLQGGGERIEASSGHDDCADALMLAMAPHKRGDGKAWATALSLAADARRQPAYTPLDIETIETPGGRRVPTSLTYGSVRGPSVTVDSCAVRRKTTRMGSRYILNP